jgi:hypothetical protein
MPNIGNSTSYGVLFSGQSDSNDPYLHITLAPGITSVFVQVSYTTTPPSGYALGSAIMVTGTTNGTTLYDWDDATGDIGHGLSASQDAAQEDYWKNFYDGQILTNGVYDPNSYLTAGPGNRFTNTFVDSTLSHDEFLSGEILTITESGWYLNANLGGIPATSPMPPIGYWVSVQMATMTLPSGGTQYMVGMVGDLSVSIANFVHGVDKLALDKNVYPIGPAPVVVSSSRDATGSPYLYFADGALDFVAADGTVTPLATMLGATVDASDLVFGNFDPSGETSTLYEQVLGRPADPVGSAGWTQALHGGADFATVRHDFAFSAEAQSDISGLYQSILGRMPGGSEVAGWQGALQSGLSLGNIRSDFATSGEAQADIAALYENVLGRSASPAEIAGREGALASGQSLSQLRSEFAGSLEAQSNIVGLYESILGRTPGGSEVAGWQGALQSGLSLANIRSDFATSGEAQANIAALYENVLGRSASPAEIAGWEGALASGQSLSQLRSEFASSLEAQSNIVGLYESILGRSPDSPEVSGWVNALASGQSLTQVRTAFATSSEARTALTTLFTTQLERGPIAPELAGLQTVLETAGSLLAASSYLSTNSPATLYTTIAGESVTAMPAPTPSPTLAEFSSSLGNDVVEFFDPSQEAVAIPTTLASTFDSIQAQLVQFVQGAAIVFNSSQSIEFLGVSPTTLSEANFVFTVPPIHRTV